MKNWAWMWSRASSIRPRTALYASSTRLMINTRFPVTGGGDPALARTIPQFSATAVGRSFGLTRFSRELSTDPTALIFARMCRRMRRSPTR